MLHNGGVESFWGALGACFLRVSEIHIIDVCSFHYSDIGRLLAAFLRSCARALVRARVRVRLHVHVHVCA